MVLKGVMYTMIKSGQILERSQLGTQYKNQDLKGVWVGQMVLKGVIRVQNKEIRLYGLERSQ